MIGILQTQQEQQHEMIGNINTLIGGYQKKRKAPKDKKAWFFVVVTWLLNITFFDPVQPLIVFNFTIIFCLFCVICFKVFIASGHLNVSHWDKLAINIQKDMFLPVYCNLLQNIINCLYSTKLWQLAIIFDTNWRKLFNTWLQTVVYGRTCKKVNFIIDKSATNGWGS